MFSLEGHTSQNSNGSDVIVEPAVTVQKPEATNDETKTEPSEESASKTDSGEEGVNEKTNQTVDCPNGKDEGSSEEGVKESSTDGVKESTEEKVKESSEEEVKDHNGEGAKDTEGRKDEGE